MSNEISLQGLELTPEERNTIITGLQANSAIQQVSPQIQGDLPLKGISEFTVGRVGARWTGEGQKKVADSEVGKVYFKPAKQTAAVVETLEASLENPEIAEALVNSASSAFAEHFDFTALGLGGIAVPNAHFGSLAAAAAVNVEAPGDFLDALAAVSDAGGDASGAIITTAAYYKLRRLRTTLNSPLFPELADRANASIEGIPVKIVRSSVAAGVVGDFAGQSKWGVAVPQFMQVKNAGTITDVSGVEHNLTDENKVAYIVETFLAFNFTDAKYFRSLTFTDTTTA